jgi:hypothetical protein
MRAGQRSYARQPRTQAELTGNSQMMRRNSVRKRDLLAEIDGESVSFLPRGKGGKGPGLALGVSGFNLAKQTA